MPANEIQLTTNIQTLCGTSGGVMNMLISAAGQSDTGEPPDQSKKLAAATPTGLVTVGTAEA